MSLVLQLWVLCANWKTLVPWTSCDSVCHYTTTIVTLRGLLLEIPPPMMLTPMTLLALFIMMLMVIWCRCIRQNEQWNTSSSPPPPLAADWLLLELNFVLRSLVSSVSSKLLYIWLGQFNTFITVDNDDDGGSTIGFDRLQLTADT